MKIMGHGIVFWLVVVAAVYVVWRVYQSKAAGTATTVKKAATKKPAATASG